MEGFAPSSRCACEHTFWIEEPCVCQANCLLSGYLRACGFQALQPPQVRRRFGHLAAQGSDHAMLPPLSFTACLPHPCFGNLLGGLGLLGPPRPHSLLRSTWMAGSPLSTSCTSHSLPCPTLDPATKASQARRVSSSQAVDHIRPATPARLLLTPLPKLSQRRRPPTPPNSP